MEDSFSKQQIISSLITNEKVDEDIQNEEPNNDDLYKKAYGYNFINIEVLKDMPHCRVTTYDDKDQENEELRKVQEISYYTEPEDPYNCVPETEYIIATTTWINKFGFEIKKEITKSSCYESIIFPEKAKMGDRYTILVERKDGIFYVRGKEFCYEYGIKKLPRFQEGKIVADKMKPDFPLVVGTSRKKITDEEILENFDKCVHIENSYLSISESPEFKEYIEYLRNGLVFALKTQSFREKIAELQNENNDLRFMLKKSYNLLEKIKSDVPGKLFLSQDDKKEISDLEHRLNEKNQC